jgi:hypothetical protein
MSMMGKLRSVHPGVVEALTKDPGLARLLVTFAREVKAPFIPDPKFLANLSPSLRAGVEAAAASHASSTGSAGARQLELAGIKPDDLDEPQSLGKGWHGAHFLLARTTYEPAPPPGDAVLGGTEIGQDLGYGPLRVMTAAEASRTAQALIQLDLPALARNTSTTDLDNAQIYPGGWPTHDSLQWLVDCLKDLTAYYQAAAARERAMLLFIS